MWQKPHYYGLGSVAIMARPILFFEGFAIVASPSKDDISENSLMAKHVCIDHWNGMNEVFLKLYSKMIGLASIRNLSRSCRFNACQLVS